MMKKQLKANNTISKLIIAGPGAGKTYNMVEQVLICMETLKSYKFCAVITYTNAAAGEIRNRLSQKIRIPTNVFIGTIHSFLNRFILIPFTSLVEDVDIDKCFLQINTDEIIKKASIKDRTQINTIKKRIYESLNKKGLITFDQTIDLAIKTIDNQIIKDILCRRLEYLFIDEFQDVSNHQFHIFETIRKQGQTNIYCVGDPEQYISSYDNDIQHFTRIPIIKAANSRNYSVEILNINYRCSESIITFLNNFNGRKYGSEVFQQEKANNQNSVKHPVYFIDTEKLSNIIANFEILYRKHGYSKKDVSIIGKKNIGTVNKIEAEVVSYKTVSSLRNSSLLEYTMEVITTIAKRSQMTIIQELQISQLDLRKFALCFIEYIRLNSLLKEDDLKAYIEKELNILIDAEIETHKHKPLVDINKLLENIRGQAIEKEVLTVSNIHNIKGLESKVVLCIAKSCRELKYWLETDIETREKTVTKKDKNDKDVKDKEYDDYYRLGYVAFSRAKELLCIGCLEEISEDLRQKIILLNVQFCPTNANNSKIMTLF